MKLFKYVAFLLLIAFIGTSIYIAVQPNEFSLSKSRVINAPASLLFNKVNDFKNWPEFFPWIEQDPNAQLIYGDTTAGKGGHYKWDGASIGEGSIKTIASDENLYISQYLIGMPAYKTESDIQWHFEPTEAGTKVTWSMEGKQNFMTKMRAVFTRTIVETMSPDFERGLFKLDSTVTADMKKYSITINGMTTHGGGYYIYSTTSSKIDQVNTTISESLPKISAYAKSNDIMTAGAPFVRYLSWDEPNNATILSVCIPTIEQVITTDNTILTGDIPAFTAIKTILKGNHSNLQEAWKLTRKHAADNQLEIVEGLMLETYLTDRTDSPNPADWTTHLYLGVIEPRVTDSTATE